MIHRSEHAKNFTMLNNEILESDLSDGAFRLLVFMLSCSDDWKFSLKGLAYCLNLSERTVSDRLTELKEAGYICQKRTTNKLGQFEACEWDVYEEPLTTPQKNHSEVKPHRGKTTLRQNHTEAEPHRGNPAVIKQVPIETSTNINKNKRKEESARFTRPTLEQVAQYCNERSNSIDPQHFIDYYNSNGWKVGRNSMKDWKAAVRTWEQREKAQHCQPKEQTEEIDWDEMARELEEKLKREGGAS